MLTSLRIWWLKKRLRAVMRCIRDLEDLVDCGNAMKAAVLPYLNKLRRRTNRLLDKLAKIDPNTPGTRYIEEYPDCEQHGDGTA